MPRWPWSKKKQSTLRLPTMVRRANLPENYANRITGFGKNAPKRTWAQWLNQKGPWKKNTRKAPVKMNNFYNLRPLNESKVKLAPGPRPALTRKRAQSEPEFAQSEPEFNYVNLNRLRGNVFGTPPQTRGRKNTPIPPSPNFNNWSTPVEFSKAPNVNLLTFPESPEKNNKGNNNSVNLLTFNTPAVTRKTIQNRHNMSEQLNKISEQAKKKLGAVARGYTTRRAFKVFKQAKAIYDEIEKIKTGRNVGHIKIIEEAIEDLDLPYATNTQKRTIKSNLLSALRNHLSVLPGYKKYLTEYESQQRRDALKPGAPKVVRMKKGPDGSLYGGTRRAARR